MFANDFQSLRPFAERDHSNIVRWSTFDAGGHYATHEVPDLFATDLREFFAALR